MKRPTVGETTVQVLADPFLPRQKHDRLQQRILDDLGLCDQKIAVGELIDEVELCGRLRWSKTELDSAIEANAIFGICDRDNRIVFPAFYSGPWLDLALPMKVTEKLGDVAGQSKGQFFTTRKQSLCRATPLGALTRGMCDAVLVAAAGFRDR